MHLTSGQHEWKHANKRQIRFKLVEASLHAESCDKSFIIFDKAHTLERCANSEGTHSTAFEGKANNNFFLII